MDFMETFLRGIGLKCVFLVITFTNVYLPDLHTELNTSAYCAAQ